MTLQLCWGRSICAPSSALIQSGAIVISCFYTQNFLQLFSHNSVTWRQSNAFEGSSRFLLFGTGQHNYTPVLYSTLLLNAFLASVQRNGDWSFCNGGQREHRERLLLPQSPLWAESWANIFYGLSRDIGAAMGFIIFTYCTGHNTICTCGNWKGHGNNISETACINSWKTAMAYKQPALRAIDTTGRSKK